VNIIPRNRTINEGVKTTFTCLATGVGNDSFTYQWFLNNYPIIEENAQILNIAAALQAHSGSYTCSVKNQYGDISQSGVAMLIILSMLLVIVVTRAQEIYLPNIYVCLKLEGHRPKD